MSCLSFFVFFLSFLSFLSFCLFVFLPFCIFVILYFCIFEFLSFCLSAFLSFCLSAFLPFCPFVFLPFCLFVFLSFCHHYHNHGVNIYYHTNFCSNRTIFQFYHTFHHKPLPLLPPTHPPPQCFLYLRYGKLSGNRMQTLGALSSEMKHMVSPILKDVTPDQDGRTDPVTNMQLDFPFHFILQLIPLVQYSNHSCLSANPCVHLVPIWTLTLILGGAHQCSPSGPHVWFSISILDKPSVTSVRIISAIDNAS